MPRDSREHPQREHLAKLTPPRLPAVLMRPRLFRLLDRARRQPVVWITAPPGYGKTTLVASYLKTRKLNTLWYQVDEGDADIATFFHYLGLAAQQAAPRHTRPLPNLTPEYLLGLPTFTRSFFQTLCKRLKSAAVLVLDNYQLVPADSKLHEVVQWAIEALPPGMRLIVLSRARPPAALARSQANQVIEVVAKEALQLTDSETKAVVRLHGTEAEKAVVQKLLPLLQKKFRGWIAGVVLLVRQATTQRAIEALSKGQTPEVVFDYLAREVLHTLSQEEQTFLITSALLPKMTAHMAEQLTEYDRGGTVLAHLARAHYFTEQRFEQAPTFEYHPLFREFLLSQLLKMRSSEQVTRLRREAGKLLEEAGWLEDAAALFHESGEHTELVRLILTQAPGLMAQGRLQTIEGWITALPSSIVEATPWLLFWFGICRTPFNPVEGLVYLKRAYGMFESQNDRTGMLLALSSLIESTIYTGGDWRPLSDWVQVVMRLTNNGVAFPSEQIERRVVFAVTHAMVFGSFHRDTAERWCRRSLVLLDDAETISEQMCVGHSLMSWLLFDGTVMQAQGLLSRLEKAYRATADKVLGELGYLTSAALFAWRQGDYEECCRLADKGLAMAEVEGVHLFSAPLVIYGPLACLELGAVARGVRYLEKMRIIAAQCPSLMIQFHGAYLSAGYACMTGNFDTAQQWLEKVEQAFNDQRMLSAIVICKVALAHVLFKERRLAEAEAQLSSLDRLGHSPFVHSSIAVWESSLLLGQIKRMQSKPDEALRYLQVGMLAGKDAGLFVLDWPMQDVLGDCCALALEHNIEPDYVKWLICKRQLIPSGVALTSEAWPWPIKVNMFGPFAIELDGKPITFERKTPKKPLELLKAIIALGGRDIPEPTLSDLLWPEAEGDAAHEAFAKTLQRLRRLLGHDDAIQLRAGKVTCNRQVCWVDALAFDHLAGEGLAGMSEAQVQAGTRALTFYKGAFLSDDDHPWADLRREKLRSKYLRLAEHLVQHWRQHGETAQAIQCVERVLALEPTADHFRRLQHPLLSDATHESVAAVE